MRANWTGRTFLIVAFGVAGFVFWRIYTGRQETLAAAQKSASSVNRPVPVLVAQVVQRTMPIYLTELGTVTAYNTVTVRPRVDGEITRVAFKEGQQVKRGAVLLQIDAASYEAAVELAQGQYARDEAAVTMGKAESARYRGLFEAGVVSQESEQAQQSIYGQAQGALKADAAAIHAAKVNLAYTTITSPIDGQVGLRQVDAGNIVHASDPNGLVVVAQLQPIAVIFSVPEDQLPVVLQKLAAKKPIKVEAYDRSMTTKLATGTLLSVDNVIDTTTGTDKLKAVFANKEKTLFPNQFVNIRLVLEDRPNALVIPAAASQLGNVGNFVYVVKNDDTVEVRPIPNAIGQGSLLLVGGGLKVGERVVVDGLEKIHPGSKISVSKNPSAAGDKADIGSAQASGKDAKPASQGDTSPPAAGKDHKAKAKGSGPTP